METKNLIQEVISLPIEERAIIVDSILRSLNPISSEIDTKWIKVAKKRLEELKSGRIKPVPGNEVFDKVWKRFSQ